MVEKRAARSWKSEATRGLTRAQRISTTMKARKIDNFASWRKSEIAAGRIKIHFPPLARNGDLAELIGVILGDGHIEKFPRTERLLIFSNSKNLGFVNRYATLVQRIFKKKPYVYKQSMQNCVRISLYEKNISKRLGIPCGSRKGIVVTVPRWVSAKRQYIIRYLRGLYEAEGSLSTHAATYTHKLNFSNTNPHLLKNVAKLLKVLGLSPHSDHLRVQLSRKLEVMRAVEMLEFRKY